MRLLNLLALIHRDGGHHTIAVDVAQSLADAEQVLYKWRGAYDVLVPHNALAQADAACGVSPGAMGSAAQVEQGEKK